MRSVSGLCTGAIVGALMFGAGGPAEARECGKFHRIQRGDTLSNIARIYYGDREAFQSVFAANRDILSDPSRIERGQLIYVPCLDNPKNRGAALAESGIQPTAVDQLGERKARRAAQQAAARALTGTEDNVAAPAREPSAVAATEVVATIAPALTAPHTSVTRSITPSVSRKEPEVVTQTPPRPVLPIPQSLEPTAETAELTPALPEPAAPKKGTVRFLTASGFEPFSDKSLPEGGLISELAQRALSTSAPNLQTEIAFVNDWEAHLTVLMPTGHFALGFPWYRPNCAQAAGLSELTQLRCTQYVYSRPLFEVEVEAYVSTRGRLVGASTVTDLAGSRICRPQGYFAFEIEQDGKIPANVELVQPQTASECFRMLKDGDVDVVSVNAVLARREISSHALYDEVFALPGLTSSQTLHVIARKDNAEAVRLLEQIDEGLLQLQNTGAWFEIVARHMRVHGERISQSN